MKSATPLKLVGICLGIALVAWLLFGFFGIQALFMDRVVDEPIPMPMMIPTSTLPALPNTVSSSTIPQANKPARTTTTTTTTTTTGPQLIGQGSFQQGDSTYTITGKAMITEQNGKRTLSLTDFDVTNGPDLFVYLVTADGSENQLVKTAVSEQKFINLGVLKGNRGNQTYNIPSDIMLNEQTLVTIWCRRFARHFGSADLTLVQP